MSIRSRIGDYLAQGFTPSGIASSAAMGTVIGLFPIMGFNTMMCGAASVSRKLNMGIMYAVCVLLTAAKFALIYPFLRLGELISGAEPFTLSLVELSAVWREDWRRALLDFGDTFLHAVLGWGICMVPAAFAVYFAILALARRLAALQMPFGISVR